MRRGVLYLLSNLTTCSLLVCCQLQTLCDTYTILLESYYALILIPCYYQKIIIIIIIIIITIIIITYSVILLEYQWLHS